MRIKALAAQYTAAWNRRDPEGAARVYSPTGWLTIDSTKHLGRADIGTSLAKYIDAFPDLVLVMERLAVDGNRATFHWTFTGTNTGPGGGKRVRLSRYEKWLLRTDGLIAESRGHFDEAEYHRQLKEGIDTDR